MLPTTEHPHRRVLTHKEKHMSRTTLRTLSATTTGRRSRRRGEDGAATAEYATTCGVGVGFGGIAYTILTSEPGRAFIEGVVDRLADLLPF